MGTDINGRTYLLSSTFLLTFKGKGGEDIHFIGRNQIFSELSSLGLAPPNIHIVVSTHGHLDHNGGVHDFPDAVHYQVGYFLPRNL